MKRTLAAVLIVGALALSGCTSRQSLDELKEIEQFQQKCADLGGTFVQWTDGFNRQNWYCDLGEDE